MKGIKARLMRNPMIASLAGMKGNARACLWPEPLWGVPYNLYLPYASLFMAALGLSPSEIGYVASINIVSQVVFATLSGQEISGVQLDAGLVGIDLHDAAADGRLDLQALFGVAQGTDTFTGLDDVVLQLFEYLVCQGNALVIFHGCASLLHLVAAGG